MGLAVRVRLSPEIGCCRSGRYPCLWPRRGALLGPFLASTTSGVSPRGGHRQHKLGKLMDRDVGANLARDFA